MQWGSTVRAGMGAGFAAMLLCGQAVQAGSVRSVTVRDLFTQAGQVVLVRVIAGDTEHYGAIVYKATVEIAYKGAKAGDTVFFGPYAGLGIGAEYVVFLEPGAGLKPKDAGGLSFGEIPSLGRIMAAGYAALPVGYECVFDEPTGERRCDDSVELNPEQIILPKTMKTFPRREDGVITTYKIWVRRSDFLPQLQKMSDAAAEKDKKQSAATG